MKKLALAVEELKVESFQTEQLDVERGTVKGHSGLTCVCPTFVRCPTILTRDCCTP
ncbi:MAG TPA: hypothetical protein VFQ39_12005 [Longimicrobium sp.]|nr:hypothetical protein [Longimicrobium sp.]